MGTYADGSTQDITPLVTWASMYSTVASVSNAAGAQGVATGVGVGITTVSATLGGKTGSSPLLVTAATLLSVAVTPQSRSLAKGLALQFTATGTYTDGTTQNLTAQVTWASSDLSVVTISNAAGSQGLASELAVGSLTISAPLGGKTDRTTLTITPAALLSITVTPTNPSISTGTTLQFTATGTYTDRSTQNLTTQVNWASLNSAAATISNAVGTQGLARGVRHGVTTISASPGGLIGSTPLEPSAPGGGFLAGTSIGVDTGPCSVAVGDLNGDGKLDVIATAFVGNTVSVLIGDGAGNFRNAGNYPVGINPQSVAVGDFNGDGKPDLAVTNRGSNDVSVLLGA